MALAIAHVQKDIALKQMALALTLMNAWKIHILAVMMQFVLTLKVAINVHVPKVTMVIPISDFVHQHNVDVLPIKNAALMKNVYNLESVFARLHSLLIRVIIVVVHAKDLLVVLMQNVVQLTHLNVCAKLDLKVIHYKVV